MNVVIQLFVFRFDDSMTPFEMAAKTQRLREYIVTLQNNINDPYIKHIYVLCESEEAMLFYSANVDTTKLSFYLIGHQPTYKEIMQFIKDTLPSNEIVCLMNGDMFFNSEKDHQLIRKHLQKHQIFALTRHEITDDNHQTHNLDTCPFTGNGGSADVFLFYTPLRDTLNLSKMDFHQNLFGAEAVFLKPWEEAGYEIWNPWDDILTLHLHTNRLHFKQYDTINTPENSTANWKTGLPPV